MCSVIIKNSKQRKNFLKFLIDIINLYLLCHCISYVVGKIQYIFCIQCINVCDVLLDSISVDSEDADFVWDDYLQETGASAVPPTAFKHVRKCIQ